jgi:hypothetical protein
MNNLQYDIFISYRHTERDRAWAKWLLDGLETYRVPKSLQKKGFPARIGKAFRDEDELPTSADLSTNIQQALEGSRFLLVICSKDTPSSLWVDKEVQTFRKLGKGDHIIPLLVEGTPETSFPASLNTLKKPVKQLDGTIIEFSEPLEPIAADVRPRNDEKTSKLKHLALLRILSAILGCTFDDLRQRDLQRQVKKKRIIYSIAAALALIVIGVSLYFWDYNRVKVAYYNTMVYRWGVPEGVGKLSEKERSHRAQSYRFEKRQGKTNRVRCENSLHYMILSKEAELIPEYLPNGRIDRLIIKEQNGRVTRIQKYQYFDNSSTPDSMILDFMNSRMVPLARSAKVGLVDKRNSMITRHLIKNNTKGYAVSLRYYNMYNMPKPDEHGNYGKLIKVDARGLAVTEEIADQSGNIAQNIGATVSFNSTYDDKGNVTEEAYSNAKGTPADGVDGISKTINRYDQYGNLIELCFFNSYGKPTLSRQGFAKATVQYDENGFIVMATEYDTLGKSVLDRFGKAGATYKHDDHGWISETTTLGIDGKPAIFIGGFSRFVNNYDDRGNLVSSQHLGLNGEPVSDIDGAYGWVFYYDGNSNMNKTEILGAKGKLALNKGGFAQYIDEYDQFDNLIKRSCLGTDGKPAINFYGYASNLMCYDERGNCIESSFYGIKGEPVMMSYGYHKRVFTYDAMGNETERVYYDERGRQVNSIGGYSRMTVSYDGNGEIVEQTWYDTKGKSVKPKKEESRQVGFVHLI